MGSKLHFLGPPGTWPRVPEPLPTAVVSAPPAARTGRGIAVAAWIAIAASFWLAVVSAIRIDIRDNLFPDDVPWTNLLLTSGMCHAERDGTTP